jgi:hypothetical protein
MTGAMCAVKDCMAPPRWELEDERGRRYLVCGLHLDPWTAYLHNRYRSACTQRALPQTPKTKPKPEPDPAPTLF